METRKSAWAEMTFFKIILCWLIVPIIWAIVCAHSYKVRINNSEINIEYGVFNKANSKYAVAGVTSISVNQSFWGRICGYGNVNISLAGNKHVCMDGVIRPHEVESYLNSKIESASKATHIMVN